MSKKVAESLDALVLDVKVGRGAFKKNQSEAEKLAKAMIQTGKSLSLRTCAFLTRMDTPLGRHVGNSLEVLEAIHALRGQGPNDLQRLVLAFGGKLLQMSGKVPTTSEGELLLASSLQDGSALKSFEAMIVAQGVCAETAKELCHGNAQSVLPKSSQVSALTASASGFVHEIDSMTVAQVCFALGSGRANPTDQPDLSVGIVLDKKVGDSIEHGDIWCRVHHQKNFTQEMSQSLQNALVVGPEPPPEKDLILSVLE